MIAMAVGILIALGWLATMVAIIIACKVAVIIEEHTNKHYEAESNESPQGEDEVDEVQ